MTEQMAPTDAEWLALREPADASARSRDLVGVLRSHLPTDGMTTIHDLGCGTGSMSRWLAPQLAGPQHWVLHEREASLLRRAVADPPRETLDGATVTTESRQQDITRLGPEGLSGASLVTASALLDVLTTDGLECLVDTIAGVGCPALIALTVSGEVEIAPRDPLDQQVIAAFNAHQRRRLGERVLLGPDALDAAVAAFRRRERDVLVRTSPWHLGIREAVLVRAWFAGWLGAACEQQPSLRADAGSYARRRMDQLAHGRLSITVGHRDLLVRPAEGWSPTAG